MSRRRALCVIALVTLIVRFVVLLWPGPDLYESGRVMAEELLRGVTAREVLKGPLLDLQSYQQPFWGGHVVIAVVAAPFIGLFGTNLFALRLATLPFALILSASGFVLLDRVAGRRPAWIGGLLLALPPPGFLLLSSTVQGTHAESVALGLGTVVLFARALEAPSRLRTALFGLACGFDLWFGYPALFAPVLVVAGTLAVRKRIPSWNHAAVGAIAFVVGAAPWIRLAFSEHPSTQIYGVPGGAWFDMSAVVSRAWHTAHDLVTQDFPLSLWLPGSMQEHVGVPAFSFAFLLLALWAFGLWETRSDFARVWKRSDRAGDSGMAIWLVLLPAVPIAFLLTSKFELGPRDWLQNLRYLLPVWPLMAFGIAIGISRLPRPADAWTTAGILACLVAAILGRLDSRAFARDMHLEIAPVRMNARIVAWTKRNDAETLAPALARLEHRDAGEQEEFLHALGLWYRWWYAESMHHDPPRTEEADRTRAELTWLHAHVAERWQPFFVAHPDEKVVLGETLEAFRAAHPADSAPR